MDPLNQHKSIELSNLIAMIERPGEIMLDIQEISLYYVPIAYFKPIDAPIEPYGVIVSDNNVMAASTIQDLAEQLKLIFGNNVQIKICNDIALHPTVH